MGAFILTLIDPSFLSAFLPVLLIAIVIYFLFVPRMGEVDRHSRADAPLLIAVAFILGSHDGFFGPGLGSFLITALVAIFGFGLLRAVAHTKLLNFASNVGGTIVLILGGHVIWVLGCAMALASVAGGQAGAYVAMRFGAGAARPLLIIMSLALTAKLLADPTNPLTATVLSWIE